MKNLDGRVCVITGASRGIGRAVAEAFAAEGAKLAIAARDSARLQATVEKLRSQGAPVMGLATDVSEEAQVIALFEGVVQEYGHVDVLVNSAGVYEEARLEETPLESWKRTIDINLTGSFLCTREAMKVMKRQRSGRIINIGSLCAQMPRPNAVAYNCSKVGVEALTRTTALVGREFGVVASCIHPGNIMTSPGMTDPNEPSMPMEDLVRTILAMATLSPGANMLEVILVPPTQPYLGRG